MATRRDDEDRSNRDKLLSAAAEAFADLGYEGTSLRTIAENAGVAFQLISYYFGSKEDLWKATVDHLYARYLETGQGLGFTLSGNIFEQFRNHMRILLTDSLQRPQIHKIVTQEQLAGGPRYENVIKPKLDHLRENLALPYYREVVRLGIVKKYTAEEVSLIYGSIQRSNIVTPYFVEKTIGHPGGSSKSIEAQVDLVFRILTEGALEEAQAIDESARATVTTRYQDRLSRMEAEIASLKEVVGGLAKKKGKR